MTQFCGWPMERRKFLGSNGLKQVVAILMGTRCSKLVGMARAQEALGRRNESLVLGLGRGLGFLARFPLWFD